MTYTKILRFSAAHRITGHEGTSRFIHGHNYRCEVTVTAKRPEGLDMQGRVIDFGAINKIIGVWIAHHWDHACILAADDDAVQVISQINSGHKLTITPGAPTVEMIARTILLAAALKLLERFDVTVTRVRIWATDTAYADVLAGEV